MSKTTVILVRHGETLWNKELRYQGQQDSPLSPKGLQQAEVVGSFLQNRSIDAVYSSDLKGAADGGKHCQTSSAHLIVDACGR